MHSSFVRLQNSFGYFTSVAFGVAIAVALSTLLLGSSPSADIRLRNVQVVKGRPAYYSTKKEEYATIKFDLEADFTSLFNWNTKQLFVWIEASYPPSSTSTDEPLSRSVIWDTIITSPVQVDPWTPSLVLADTIDFYHSLVHRFEDFRSGKSYSKNTYRPGYRPQKPPNRQTKRQRDAALKKAQGTTTPGLISLKNVRPKYQITDISGFMAERQNVTLSVGYNVQPYVGVLTWQFPEGKGFWKWQGVKNGKSKAFALPDLKGKTVVVGEKETPAAAGAAPVL